MVKSSCLDAFGPEICRVALPRKLKSLAEQEAKAVKEKETLGAARESKELRKKGVCIIRRCFLV